MRIKKDLEIPTSDNDFLSTNTVTKETLTTDLVEIVFVDPRKVFVSKDPG